MSCSSRGIVPSDSFTPFCGRAHRDCHHLNNLSHRELRGRSERVSYAGVARAHPLLAMSLVIAFLSLIGIPPLLGFGAKLALFTAAIEATYEWLAIVAAINTVVSIFYQCFPQRRAEEKAVYIPRNRGIADGEQAR